MTTQDTQTGPANGERARGATTGARIFIGYTRHQTSDDPSYTVAVALRELLRTVFPKTKPFHAELDMEMGSEWPDALAARLRDAYCGIICITPFNRTAPWLLFEAGILAARTPSQGGRADSRDGRSLSRLLPFLIGLGADELGEPLVRFQAASPKEEDCKRLVDGIALRLPSSARTKKEERATAFAAAWPIFERACGNAIREVMKRKRLNAAGLGVSSYLAATKVAVCDLQGILAQYSLLAGERHKSIKDELHRANPAPAVLRSNSELLLAHLDDGFQSAAKIVFRYLHTIMEKRSTAPERPRFCVKAYVAREGQRWQDGIIHTVFRDRRTINDRAYPVSANRGFLEVFETQRYYLQNDIPAATASGTYKNPRISERMAGMYAAAPSTEFPDRAWMACFTADDAGAADRTASDCYKSTLIVPMTLINNQLAMEFRTRLGIDQNIQKSCFGFLCMDHCETHFFNENEDVAVGYVMADLLSLCLVVRATYVSSSPTYQRAQSVIDSAGRGA